MEILKGLANRQTDGVLEYVVQVWHVTDSMLVMPDGLDLSIVCRDFVLSSIGGIPLAPARDDLLVFTKNILGAVAWMHRQQVVHLDPKLRNMLLMSHGRVVLCDFGCAARLGNLPSHQMWGTRGFTCPEHRPSTAADVWSVGSILRPTWQADCAPGVAYQAPAIVRLAIDRCMQPDASQRSDLLDVLNDDEMQKVNDHRKQYMNWPAEQRLCMAAWYTYQVAFKERRMRLSLPFGEML